MKKCPRCELNYIQDDEELCAICRLQKNVASVNVGELHIDFKSLICGRMYGTNSKNIYLACCEVFGWKKSLSGNFGRQRPCYAELIDDVNNVWFITDSNLTGTKGSSGKWTNEVLKGGEQILEHWETPPSNFPADKLNRIVFVKQDGEYVFLGVYKRVKQEGSIRVFERVCRAYP